MKRRVLAVVAVLAFALPLSGCLYETSAAARAARQFPPPGRLVDVGGRSLHLLCIGTGRPVVLFEASGFSNSASSAVARDAVARHTTVCSYDRAGVGWSDPATGPASIGRLADDLRRLSDNAPLDPPFVIVASSIGGTVSELFARRYPARVAGLVFADAGNSEMIASANEVATASVRFEAGAACAALSAAGSVGLVRLFDPFAFRRDSSPGADRAAALMYRARPWKALCGLVSNLSDSVAEFEQAPALRPDLPLVVLSAERSDNLIPGRLPQDLQERGVLGELYRRFQPSHRRLAQKSSRGTWRLVRNSGHLIASDQPQAVIDATLDVLGQVSDASRPVPSSLR